MPLSAPKLADPQAPIPFDRAPHGPVKVINVRTPGGGTIPYYRFTTKGKRTYVVDLPVSMTKQARSKDEWITLFTCYGRDPAAEADVSAETGSSFIDSYTVWSNLRIFDQAAIVQAIRGTIARQAIEMTFWSSIHREAKTNNDMIKAQAAWQHISNAKYDLKNSLRKLAREKLQLGKRYKEAGAFNLAEQQFTQTAQLSVWPYSAEAVAKMKVITGARPEPAAYSTAAQVGLEWVQLSDLYQAAARALSTNP